ncbi:MAG: thioredoxin domain-containing protein [Minisyncoccia bacterium]
MKNILPTVGIIGAALLVFIGAYFLTNKKSVPQALTAEQEQALMVAKDDYVVGPADSKVVLVEYSDFECPACAAFHPVVKELIAKHPEMKFVARYFPLQGHMNGMASALATEAAGKQGKFWEMHDKLFETQKEWGGKNVADPAYFEGVANTLGLDMERFAMDVASPETKARVQRDYDGGITAGVRGTPTFFLNGKPLDMPGSFEAFSQLITDAGTGPVTPVEEKK